MKQDGPAQLALPLGHRVARDMKDFLVTPSNLRAVEWVDRWPDWPFTALIVVGPEGSGKSHIAACWRARSNAEAIDISRSGLEESVETAAHAGAAMLEDADRILAGDARAELSLLQLYNLMRSAGGTLLITARTPPAAWPIGLADLRSRLNSAMVIAIDPPDDALLAGVALKQFADRQIDPAGGVIPFLLSHEERSFAAIARAVTTLDHAALARKRPITVALAREVLAGLHENGAAERVPE